MTTLKEAIEILRGETVHVFKGEPMEIPCIETSDAEKLCKNPVVSVHMITYNHEPYIRQAIEGVMMQQTDFEFELVIGDDCSQDKTREICFEYQKKYPDRIRVLWWHENVSKLGGNSRRVTARCRGEFIAFCEGDDYWIDPLKLQKQVDLIRQENAILCVANSEWHYPNGRIEQSVYETTSTILSLEDLVAHYFHTSTYLFRRDALLKCYQCYSEFILWYDVVITHTLATLGKVCFLPNCVSVYNWTGRGTSSTPHSAERLRLLLVQYAQFALCPISRVAHLYYQRVKWYFPFACVSASAEGNFFTDEMCARIIRVARLLAQHNEGRWGEIKIILWCYLRLLQRYLRPLYRRIRYITLR